MKQAGPGLIDFFPTACYTDIKLFTCYFVVLVTVRVREDEDHKKAREDRWNKR